MFREASSTHILSMICHLLGLCCNYWHLCWGTFNTAQIPVLPGDVQQSLTWWISLERLTARALFVAPAPQETVMTDGSQWGLGAHLGSLCMGAAWNTDLQDHHINFLELMVIKYGVLTFRKQLQGWTMLITSDNNGGCVGQEMGGGGESPGDCVP